MRWNIACDQNDTKAGAQSFDYAMVPAQSWVYLVPDCAKNLFFELNHEALAN